MPPPFALIIEDDPSLGIIFTKALQQVGYQTDIDVNGNQWRQKLSAVENISLIVLDIHMPYGSGIDIFHQIRSQEVWSKVPIVVTTADIVLAKSLETLTDQIWIKPISPRRLMDFAAHLWSTS